MILLVILLITILTLLFSYNKREVQEVIENNYKNDDNLIKNYAKNSQKQKNILVGGCFFM